MRRALLLRRPTRRRSAPHRALVTGFATVVIAAALLPTLSWAHAVVFPRASAPGAYEKYVLRVPNEKAVATAESERNHLVAVSSEPFAEGRGHSITLPVSSA